MQQDLAYTSRDVMIPHTIMLGRDLEIFKIYNGYYYWGRPAMSELHADRRELTRQTQRDWDITQPKLRQEWTSGDRSSFYPYSKQSISMHKLMLQTVGAVDQYAGSANDR